MVVVVVVVSPDVVIAVAPSDELITGSVVVGWLITGSVSASLGTVGGEVGLSESFSASISLFLFLVIIHLSSRWVLHQLCYRML